MLLMLNIKFDFIIHVTISSFFVVVHGYSIWCWQNPNFGIIPLNFEILPHFFSGMCIINIRSFEIFRSLAFSHSRSLIFFWLLGSNIDISCDKYLRHTSSEFIRLSNNFKRKYNSTLHKSCRFLLVSFCATHTHTYTQAHMQARTVFVGHARENILLHIRAHMERSNDITYTQREKKP